MVLAESEKQMSYPLGLATSPPEAVFARKLQAPEMRMVKLLCVDGTLGLAMSTVFELHDRRAGCSIPRSVNSKITGIATDYRQLEPHDLNLFHKSLNYQ